MPVVPRGSRAEILHETLKESNIWDSVSTIQLTQNMRLHTGGPEVKEFADYLLRIGEAKETVYPEVGEDMVLIPEQFKSRSKNLREFCDEIYPDMKNTVERSQAAGDGQWIKYLMERSIICPTNLQVDELNRIMIEKFPGTPFIMKSFDKVLNVSDEHNYPTEFLNSIQLSSIPPHLMVLKEGCPIQMMRNLDPMNGHVNGARYIVKTLSNRIIHAQIAVGPHAGKEILIPRILFHPDDKSIPFEFERRQITEFKHGILHVIVLKLLKHQPSNAPTCWHFLCDT